MSGVNVSDGGDLRKYRTEIPNAVLEIGLSPSALALYVHLKRTAGAGEGGECFKSTRTLAKDSGLSAGKVSEARAELEQHELIQIERPKDKTKSARVRITDVWAWNFAHFAQSKEDDKERSDSERTPDSCSDNERRVQHMNASCSDNERKKEPSKERTPEEGSEEKTSFSSGDTAVSANASAPAEAAPPSSEKNKPPKPKGVSYRSYCHQRSREIQKEAQALGWKPDTLPEKTVGEWSAFYEEAITRDGYTVEELDAPLWWLFRKASGLIEGEPQAWAYFGRAMREVEHEQAESGPPTADPEQQALAEQNRRDALTLLYGENIPDELRQRAG